MFRKAVLGVFVAAGLVLTGCSLDEPTVTEPDAVTSSESPAAEPVAKPTQEPAAEPVEKVANFKQAYTYDDGLKIQVSKIDTAKAGEYAMGAKPGASVLVLTVKITNGTKTVIDPALLTAALTYGADGTEVEQVFDGDLGGGFSAKIAPGKSASAEFGYSVPKAGYGSVTFDVSPDFERESALFSGPVSVS